MSERQIAFLESVYFPMLSAQSKFKRGNSAKCQLSYFIPKNSTDPELSWYLSDILIIEKHKIVFEFAGL